GEPIPVSEGSSDSDSPLTQSVKAVAPGTVSSVVKSQVGENAENPESTPAEKSDEKTSQKTDEPNETENKQSADTSNKSTKSLETEAQDRNIDTTVSEVDDPDNTNQEKLKEAEAQPLSAQEADIERHIAAGTYAVPIDTVRRRRRTITIFAVLTLLTLLITLDLLLDLDVLQNSSVPHTNFL
ncbi:MAG: hypothetical protein JNK33_06100, partial [Candidatus Doudnabacteria bacterium]|nr:hypothetical protein [Candidatus Doudnabacteria bacterium]